MVAKVLGGSPVEEVQMVGTATIVDDDEPSTTTTTTTTTRRAMMRSPCITFAISLGARNMSSLSSSAMKNP